MPGPTPTGNILVLYGHGAVTDKEFDFKRADTARINLYAWTREGIAVWDRQIQLAANDAIANGTIRNSYATVNSSRIGGTPFKDCVIGPPDGLALPTVPDGYVTTQIPALNATVWHSSDTLATSARMLLMIDDDQPAVYMSDILYDPNFANRALDVLWCACKSKLG